MSQSGWISLHRKTLENPIICKDSDYFSVWCYLLLNATHQEYDVIFDGKRTTLQKGQFLIGRKKIGEFLKISESKVQRILKTFENEQQIEQQTGTKNRLISIVSWDTYQKSEQQNEQQVNIKRTTSEQQVNNKRTTSEQQVNTNNNINNINNINNKNNKIIKHKYGEYKNVLLTDSEYQKLTESYSNFLHLIKFLDEYIEMKGYKAKSHYLAIKKWVVAALNNKQYKEAPKSTYKEE